MRTEERSIPPAGSLALYRLLQVRAKQLRSAVPADASRPCRIREKERPREIDPLLRSREKERPGEIDPLRRSEAASLLPFPRPAAHEPIALPAPGPSVARDPEPKLYAVTPLGRWEAEPREAPPVVPPHVRIVPPHVTNVGSVIDVLA